MNHIIEEGIAKSCSRKRELAAEPKLATRLLVRAAMFLLLAFLLGMLISLDADAQSEYLGDIVVASEQNSQIGEVYQHILRLSPKPPHDPLELAVSFVDAGLRYGLDPHLLVAIGFVESRFFVGAINKKSNDFGLMQVNAYNIKAMKLDKQRLLSDIDYSINAGAAILSYFKRRYAKGQPKTWYCRYNVGVRPLKGALFRICKSYYRKVRRAL